MSAPVELAARASVAKYTVQQAREIAAQVSRSLNQSAEASARAGIAAARTYMSTMGSGGKISPLDDRAAIGRILDSYGAHVEEQQAAIGARMATTMADRMRATALRSSAPTVGSYLEDLEIELENQWNGIRRVAATETSYAFNRGQVEALTYAAKELDIPDLWLRWSERIDERTLDPLDSRVGIDSVVMHAQVAKPGKLFTMPHDKRVHHSLYKSWFCPPNRPNDRAVLTPWMRGWGLTGWVLQAGVRVSL